MELDDKGKVPGQALRFFKRSFGPDISDLFIDLVVCIVGVFGVLLCLTGF